ncbi:hypothetical protein T492DRAFT_836856 [Pavlovales sp. CCMP2436]|nr:hypothetical protein T492DRAFT_836856 [Pavlovales sp. CCMP2436]
MFRMVGSVPDITASSEEGGLERRGTVASSEEGGWGRVLANATKSGWEGYYPKRESVRERVPGRDSRRDSRRESDKNEVHRIGVAAPPAHPLVGLGLWSYTTGGYVNFRGLLDAGGMASNPASGGGKTANSPPVAGPVLEATDSPGNPPLAHAYTHSTHTHTRAHNYAHIPPPSLLPLPPAAADRPDMTVESLEAPTKTSDTGLDYLADSKYGQADPIGKISSLYGTLGIQATQ